MKTNNIDLQLKIEKFFKEELWQHILVVAFVCFCAWLFNKWILAPMVYLSDIIVRLQFEKQYHCTHSKHAIAVGLCMWLTCTVIFFTVAYCLPLTISLLSCLPISYFSAWIGYIAQDRLDIKIILKKLTNKTIWQMTENELADYCYAKGIRGDMLEFVLMVVVHQMKYEEIGAELGYSVDTLKDWSPKCKAKLGIKSWKQDKN